MLLRLLIKAGWAPISVLLVHTGYIRLFGHPPELDLVMHVLGGFAIAYALHSAIPILRPLLGPLRLEAHCLLVLGHSFLIAMLWEYLEFAGDMLLFSAAQASVRETMGDLLLGTAAATLCTVTIYLRYELLPPKDALAES